MSSRSNRTQRRYRVVDREDGLQGTFTLGSRTADVKLVNLSPNGVNVIVPFRAEKGSMFQLSLAAEPVGFRCLLSAVVQWTAVVSVSQWQLGCRLTDAISLDDLDRLCVADFLDRRRVSRFELSESVFVKTELGNAMMSGTITDISPDGLCFRAQPGLAKNDFVQIEACGESLTNRDKWYAVIVWTRYDHDCNEAVYGCRITGHKDRDCPPPLHRGRLVGSDCEI